MKIRTRLAILFTVVTAAILLIFVSAIYLSAKSNREKEFYFLLEKEAVTKANLFFNAKVESRTLQDIYRNNRKILNEVQVAIYDTSFRLLYHDAHDIDHVKETKGMIDTIWQKGELLFYQDEWQVTGLRYSFQDKDYVVIATAYDQYGYNKLDSLLKNSIFVFIASILFIYMAGRFFSKKALEPVKEMSEKAKRISATNLDLRITSNRSKDELSELANTFNEMLTRLENSFEAQKHFVSNIAHESRTPLSAIITELELSISKDRTIGEYKNAIGNALADARKLARLSGSLLDLAKASYDPSEIAFRPIRIDEVLLDARQQTKQANPLYKIDIHFDSEFLLGENDRQISIYGNEYLLKVAFANLFENGCKFSEDKRSSVSISIGDDKILLRFTDHGVGISESDMDNIFIPFYRGENKRYAYGNGIGLPLTRKIIALHKGAIAVSSAKNEGTTFQVELTPMAED